MTPCSTLEQRWSACRAPVYQRRQRLVARVFRWGAMGSRTGHRRPCTSPRRHQCKSDFWCPWDTQDTYCDDRPDV